MCRIDRDMVASAPNLRLINQFGVSDAVVACMGEWMMWRVVDLGLLVQHGCWIQVGLEGVDVKACAEHGVYVTNIPSDGTGNAASCAEHALYLMLGLLRRQNQMQVCTGGQLSVGQA